MSSVLDEAIAFEQRVAAMLGAAWVERPLYTSAPDVVGVPGWPEVRVECKLRKEQTVHRWARETMERYGGVPCVVTGERGSDEAYATVPLAWLAELVGVGEGAADFAGSFQATPHRPVAGNHGV